MPRLYLSPTRLLTLAVAALLLLALAAPAPAAVLPSPGGELTAIDVPLDALPILQALDIRYLPQPHEGRLRAAASAEQLAALEQAGVSVTILDRVLIVEGGAGPEPQSPDYCTPGLNGTNVTLAQDQYRYSRSWVNCPAANNASVTVIDVYYKINEAYGNSDLDVFLDSANPFARHTLESYNYCADIDHPSSPIPAKTVYGIHTFDGYTVNQAWDLTVYQHCVLSGFIDEWQIWVHYWPVTPTRTATSVPTRTATSVPTWRLQGRVYDGWVGDESHPLQGVTVRLYCSSNEPVQGNLIASTTTNSDGWYGLDTSAVCEYYNIVESDPAGYSSVGATSVSGVIVNANWIQYIIPLNGKTLTGNKFWDRRPTTPTPTHGPLMRRIYCPIILKEFAGE